MCSRIIFFEEIISLESQSEQLLISNISCQQVSCKRKGQIHPMQHVEIGPELMRLLKTRSAALNWYDCNNNLSSCLPHSAGFVSPCCSTQLLRLAWLGASTRCVCFSLSIYIHPVMKWWLVETWHGSAPHTSHPPISSHRLDPELEISVARRWADGNQWPISKLGVPI